MAWDARHLLKIEALHGIRLLSERQPQQDSGHRQADPASLGQLAEPLPAQRRFFRLGPAVAWVGLSQKRSPRETRDTGKPAQHFRIAHGPCERIVARHHAPRVAARRHGIFHQNAPRLALAKVVRRTQVGRQSGLGNIHQIELQLAAGLDRPHQMKHGPPRGLQRPKLGVVQ